ncbi:MAG: transcription termination factor Rho [Opitutaceae bacterium]|nr:transcription termination factor Rho [Opitutaceae bacterium]
MPATPPVEKPEAANPATAPVVAETSAVAPPPESPAPEYDRDGGNGDFYHKGHKHRRHDRKKRFGGGGWNQNAGPQSAKYPPQPSPPSGAVYYGDLPDPARFQDLGALERIADEIADKETEPIWLNELYQLNLADLTSKARQLGANFEGAPSRKQLLSQIFQIAGERKIPLYDRGWIDATDRGHGFVVHMAVNYRLYPENAYLPEAFIRRYGLKRGLEVEVQVQPPQGNDRCPAVVRISKAMGLAPEEIAKIKPFEELTPYYPLKRILLEVPGQKDISMRMVDILTPVGFGQRGLIVAPPRTGKTILLQNIANSVAANCPEALLIILLVDERPEEVTDFRRHCKGEVVSSTFDETPESHVHAAEMVIEKARRLVEMGQHVVILLDSITRLARAYNALASNSGKIMSGGIEATALQKPKRFFGSARNIDIAGGGSLTILGTALIDTGSRMDEVIFEEFKGTGNMELHLDRDLSNKRIFPAINADRSGTRKEELIYHPDELTRIYSLRRAMQGVPAADSMEMLISRLRKTKTNVEFLMSLNR